MNSNRRLLLSLIAVAVLTSGCSDPISEAGFVEPQMAVTLKDLEFADRPSEGHEGDEYLYNISREVPAYGGHFWDGNSAIVAWSTDPSQNTAIERAIKTRIANGVIFVREGNASARVRVEKAEYTVRQLGAWRDSIFAARRELKWTMLDLDEGRNRVTIGVPRGLDASESSTFMKAIARMGVPTGAVRSVEVDPQLTRQTAANLGSYVDSLAGGFRFTFSKNNGWYLCTIGFPVLLSNGTRGIISAAHCSADKWYTDGAAIQQPVFNGTNIGYELWDMAPGTCPFLRFCNDYRFSDASLFAVNGRAVNVGRIARPSTRVQNFSTDTTISTSSPSIQVVNETSSITQNTIVDVVGATTGWTYSTVENTCVSVHTSGLNRCSYFIHADIEGGDSGAPAFYYNTTTGTATAVGVVFAKSNTGTSSHYGIFSKMMYVRSEIQSSGLTFSLTGTTPPQQPWAAINGAYSVTPNASCYFYASSSVTSGTVSWKVNGIAAGTSWGITVSSSGSFLLEFEANDGINVVQASRMVTVDESAPNCNVE